MYRSSKDKVMSAERLVKLFRNGANQALRIPRDMELPGDNAVLRKEGGRLIVEAMERPSLLTVLASLKPIAEEFPPIKSLPAAAVEI